MQSRSCEKGSMRIIYTKQAASFGTWEADGGGQDGREAAALRRRLMQLTQVKLAASFGTRMEADGGGYEAGGRSTEERADAADTGEARSIVWDIARDCSR